MAYILWVTYLIVVLFFVAAMKLSSDLSRQEEQEMTERNPDTDEEL